MKYGSFHSLSCVKSIKEASALFRCFLDGVVIFVVVFRFRHDKYLTKYRVKNVGGKKILYPGKGSG